MASILKVDDLRGNTSAGNITITSEGGAATQSLQQGLCKSWCRWSQSGTQTVNDSLNISSITDTGTGYTTLTMTNVMSSIYHSVSGFGASGYSMMFNGSPTASSWPIQNWYGGTAYDNPTSCSQTNGDLA
jgi:hypothetical protein